jgi:hypothetical protein
MAEPMRRILPVLLLVLPLALTPAQATRNPNHYPSELPRFAFYVKYLAPLRPYISDLRLVVRVFGSDEGIALTEWRITPFFVGQKNTVNGHPWAIDVIGHLADVEVRPKKTVSLLGMTFPAAFTYSSGGVSEINVSCDVYSDRFGLQYWLYAEDSKVAKKGDLMKIVYGPSKRVERQIVGPS